MAEIAALAEPIISLVILVVGGALITAGLFRFFSKRWPSERYVGLMFTISVLVPAALFAFTLFYSLQRSASAPDAQANKIEPLDPAARLPRRFLAQSFILPRDKPMVEAVRNGLAAVLVKRNTPEIVHLCRAVMSYEGIEPYDPYRVTTMDGQRYLVRPIYWFVTKITKTDKLTDDVCLIAARRYDYDRAEAIIQRLNLKGKGPFMTVAGFRDAGVYPLRTWELEGIPPDEFDDSMTQMVIYFRGTLIKKSNVYANNRQLVKSFILDNSIDIPALFGFPAAEAKQ